MTAQHSCQQQFNAPHYLKALYLLVCLRLSSMDFVASFILPTLMLLLVHAVHPLIEMLVVVVVAFLGYVLPQAPGHEKENEIQR
jgi:hypothetical protein